MIKTPKQWNDKIKNLWNVPKEEKPRIKGQIQG
jgi:hypothetical protein